MPIQLSLTQTIIKYCRQKKASAHASLGSRPRLTWMTNRITTKGFCEELALKPYPTTSMAWRADCQPSYRQLRAAQIAHAAEPHEELEGPCPLALEEVEAVRNEDERKGNDPDNCQGQTWGVSAETWSERPEPLTDRARRPECTRRLICQLLHQVSVFLGSSDLYTGSSCL